MAESDEKCPECDGDLKLLGFFLCRRAEDDKRVCRTPLRCATCGTVWTRWADRDDPLERDDFFPPTLRF